MDSSNSTPYSRTLAFTRSRTRNGLFTWPTTTFTLREKDGGPELGQLQIRGRKATYSAASAGESFNLKKSFWGNRWLYVGDDEREFGRLGFGWVLMPSFTFADGSRYYLRTKRRWPFSNSKAGKPTQSASFLRDDMEVMLLQNFAQMHLFSREIAAPMEGTIGTNINELRTIVGLLLFYQGHIERRNKSAH